MIDLLFIGFRPNLFSKYFYPDPDFYSDPYKTGVMMIILVILKLWVSLFGNGFRINTPVNRGYRPVGLNYNLQVTPVPILNVNNPLIIVCGLKLEDDIIFWKYFSQ